MSNYHVSKDKDTNKWRIMKEGGERASGFFDTQKEGEKRAKELASNSGGGEVRIHRSKGGQIRDSDTVKPGRDPNPPRDKVG